ncbi:hypothetical protein ADIS_2463 [Lunatimonas lonarensis]|uniref:Uncharacterized protein n=1 Tax=Lunatimonas lonarensis TaxID=1232681 RepID=R7ZSM2_9BACT|nr:hypothetical protein ADIS_2463 [Lunatimonas lonarensis]
MSIIVFQRSQLVQVYRDACRQTGNPSLPGGGLDFIVDVLFVPVRHRLLAESLTGGLRKA